MSETRPAVWEESYPVWTDKAMLQDLFAEATERFVWDEFDPALESAWDKLRTMIEGNQDAVALSKDIEEIYFNMIGRSWTVLAAIAPHVACRPLSPGAVLASAVHQAGLHNLANEKQGGNNEQDH